MHLVTEYCTGEVLLTNVCFVLLQSPPQTHTHTHTHFLIDVLVVKPFMSFVTTFVKHKNSRNHIVHTHK